MNEGIGIGGKGVSGTTEKTYLIARDLWYRLGGLALAEKVLFSSADAYSTTQRSSLLSDLANQVLKAQFLTISMNHNFQFAQVNSEPAGSNQQYFNDMSRLAVTVLQKQYDDIPFSYLLPFNTVWDGTNWAIQRKTDDFFVIPEPITLPPGGNIVFKVIPASTSLTTAAAGVTNPKLFDLSLTSDRAFWATFRFNGWQERYVG